MNGINHKPSSEYVWRGNEYWIVERRYREFFSRQAWTISSCTALSLHKWPPTNASESYIWVANSAATKEHVHFYMITAWSKTLFRAWTVLRPVEGCVHLQPVWKGNSGTLALVAISNSELRGPNRIHTEHRKCDQNSRDTQKLSLMLLWLRKGTNKKILMNSGLYILFLQRQSSLLSHLTSNLWKLLVPSCLCQDNMH